MIKIVEDGVEYTFKREKQKCKLMTNGNRCGNCDKDRPVTYELCNILNSSYSCTSAQKVTEEAKVYGPGMTLLATHLIGKKIEYWNGADGWVGPFELIAIDHNAFNTPFRHYYDHHDTKKWSGAIREIPTRHLTFTQIKALHPDLEDVVLIEED